MEGAMVCLDGGVLAALALKQEAGRQLGAEVVSQLCDTDGRSRASSCTDASLPGRLADTAEQQEHAANKTHHLLRHCLNWGQRQQALAHFSSTDVKEAAKEISRMGQRELQGKFKLVYGNTTHSNNNNWLRRKLFEAIGAAPLKANSKGSKSRKPQSSSRKEKAHSVEPPCRNAGAAAARNAAGMHHSGMVPTLATGLRCSPRPYSGPAHTGSLPVPVAAKQHQLLLRPAVAGAPRRMASYPSSPLLGGVSVLDHYSRYESALSRETSDSEDGSWEEGEEEERRGNYAGSSSSSPYAPRALAMPPAAAGGVGLAFPVSEPTSPHAPAPAGQLAGPLPLPQHTGGQPEALGLGTIDLGFGDSNTDWMRETWGYGCDDVLSSFGLAGPAPARPAGAGAGAPSPSTTSLEEDDDTMLLPMDLSAIDAIDAFAFA